MTTPILTSFALSAVLAALVSGCAVEVGDAEETTDVGDAEETVDDETNDQTGDVGLIEALGAMEYNVAVEGDHEPISEGPWVYGYKTTGGLYGTGGFDRYGDVFFANDRSKDGYDIGIHWEDPTGGRQGLCRLRESVVLGYCDKNLPEGDTIRYQIGRCKPSTTDCTRWANYINRSAFKSVTNNN